MQKIRMTKEQFNNKVQHLMEGNTNHIYLDSARDGKSSIFGRLPFEKYEAKEDGLLVTNQLGEEWLPGDALQQLEERLQQYKQTENLGELFSGGIIGYISYDYVRQQVQLAEKATRRSNLPLFYFYLFEHWAVFDEEKEEVYLFVLNREEKRMKEWLSQWKKAKDTQSTSHQSYYTKSELTQSVSQQQFEKNVTAVQDAIKENQVTQVNLSVRQSKKTNVPASVYYQQLRNLNPSPYMALIEHPEFQVASASPELLIKKTGSHLITKPIGGTRRRGQTHEEDLELAKDLASSRKELEEHQMLVDLEVDDFQKVCTQETVRVTKSNTIETYSHVLHLVSTIEGELKEKCSWSQLFNAIFPGGSITGDPKLPTFELIEELEPERRGLYTGSIGWIGFNGDMELNIVIRTAIFEAGEVTVQAGAGLTIDSNPTDEYVESLTKAEALWKALEECTDVED